MPIRPDLKHLYSHDWKAISHRIRFGRAGGRCESCGVAHDARGLRQPDGSFEVWSAERIAAHPHVKLTRIVLTTAHLNHDPRDNRDENLAAWCQRCHLAYDLDKHVESRILRRHRRAIEGGQRPLFDAVTWAVLWEADAKLS